MSDNFTSGEKHYMHLNGDVANYLPFNYTSTGGTTATFTSSNDGHHTGLGPQTDESSNLYIEPVVEASSNDKSESQNGACEPVVLLLWKELFNVTRYSKPDPSFIFRFTKDEVIVQQGLYVNSSQKRSLADSNVGKPKRQRKEFA
ncbi:hypothetical protein LTS02_017480 [Friedmanniomyces endolithicus]|nr:hypothetical protein LTR75_017921 [Friedmanniomyces endolithicus]KAK0839483.1 hypothetical protein LTS02_017480 [Friedmanniomyces endolithicus]